MKVVYETCDGNVYDSRDSAVQHERDFIKAKIRRMQRLKSRDLPHAQREYNDTTKKLRLFREANKLACLPKSRYYTELGTLYCLKGQALATLNHYIAEYRKLKIELEALTK